MPDRGLLALAFVQDPSVFEKGSEGFPSEDEAFSHGLRVGGGTMSGSHWSLHAWENEQADSQSCLRVSTSCVYRGKWEIVRWHGCSLFSPWMLSSLLYAYGII